MVYGASKARYYQDGQHFDGAGNLISDEEASAATGLSKRESEQLRKENELLDEGLTGDEQQSTETDQAPEPDPPAEVTEMPDDPEAVTDPGWKARYEELMGEHHQTLAEMALEASDSMSDESIPKAPFKGSGSKAKNAAWLATYAVE